RASTTPSATTTYIEPLRDPDVNNKLLSDLAGRRGQPLRYAPWTFPEADRQTNRERVLLHHPRGTTAGPVRGTPAPMRHHFRRRQARRLSARLPHPARPRHQSTLFRMLRLAAEKNHLFCMPRLARKKTVGVCGILLGLHDLGSRL